MADDLVNPFPPETLDDLKRRLIELDQADVLIEKAARGGINVADQKSKSADLRKQLLQFRQAFFPGQ
jgi:hypothetical protein